MRPQPIADYIFTDHARLEILRRGLSEEMVRAILLAPEERIEVRPGREVLQSKISSGQPGKVFLIRVFVDIDRHPAEVVTAYRTSKIEKYWREP
ncbi:MAG: DUF4258 domain-containing protein [Nitrospira sp.]|nr:DUF4258 domain-containing protein [Nitrospira sp.]MDH4252470.1 DUF4258 domain-containing protein [Nitrospira sp.]MDH5336400.1 DUF4258 domain-containing protein [Nitrospira sp.]